MENILDIINKAQLKTIDKDTFLSIASMCSFIPKSITENNTWKKLPLSAKEVYRTLVANYDYELGIAKTTHSQILNEAGIGGNATIVKSLDVLEEKGFITRVESKAKSHHYLMPYQEKFYATVCNFEARDFSILYTINKKVKKDTQIKQVTNKLFFKVCYNLSCLGIDEPQKLIDKYSSDGNRLRIILSMCNYIYIAKEKNLNKDINLNKYLIDSLKRGNITENIFDEKTMNTIKNILINRKQNITE
ncbi:hypothetical protein A966_02866 [Brachyspira hampsonii 30446]|uniref:Uncharacterized protein n=1 Tax=Brachyspira hampsonii 30446 TaxID=1289135 RepID=A0A2U4FE28_9SPIR|nr:hypothetical protein [Brachyspira hampsonii]EKV57824.1 hypothetical protein A966_02866 [Brachyspira hampsonii 30446]MBW5395820.1 hypothetical protein [Brachyspira hampsonii]OEJ15081.1 hypothetical protein A9495_00890 [Brachyspira hampsonii]